MRALLAALTTLLAGACSTSGASWAPEGGYPEIPALSASSALPDPLRTWRGEEVAGPHQWRAERRPELIGLFQQYVYGWMGPPLEVSAKVLTEATPVLEGRATLREVELSFPALGDGAPTILLAMFLPPGEGAVPVFLGMNKCGNSSVVPDEAVTMRPHPVRHRACSEEEFANRGSRTGTWCVRDLTARGYGLVTFTVADIDPDVDDPSVGIQVWTGPEAGPSWGTLAAWAWGLSRAVDHLVTEPRIDPDAIAVIGHSRRGKAALLAGAFDERIALVVPHQSGTGGCALSRDNDQETVERITTNFPHWFGESFTAFSANEELLPVDQHLLVALVAPRPLLETVGLQDTWANYDSSLRGLGAAAPVWELFTAGESSLPVVLGSSTEERELSAPLAQLRLDKPHVLDADYWKLILDYADHHLSR